MADNPFYVAPPNALQALMSGLEGFDAGRKLYKEQQEDAAYKELGQTIQRDGGLSNGALAKLLSMGRNAAPVVQAVGSLQRSETTDTLKNLAAENKMRVAQGLKPLGPLDYQKQVEAAKAAITNVHTNVNAAVNPVLKGVSDRFNEAVESANSARDQISSIHEGRQALDDGATTGAFADKRLFGTKVAGLFGLPQDTATNTEVLRAALGNQVLAKAKTLGANPSNADRDYIEKVSGGSIELNEGSLRKIIDIQERWAREAIKRANRTGQSLLSAYPDELGRVKGLLNVEEPAPYQRRIAPAAPVPAAPQAAQPSRTQTGVQWRVVQ